MLSSAVFTRIKMQVRELIDKVNTEKPNSFTDKYLLSLVNEVEAMVYDYLETPDVERIYHVFSEIEESGESGESGTSGEEEGLMRELLVPEPYSSMYESYLRARLDYANEEYDLYANNTAQFNEDMDAYRAYAMRHGLVDTSYLPDKITNWM